MSHETYDAIAIILIVLAAGDLLVTLVLLRAAHRLNEPALTERATSSAILTAIACIGAYVGLVILADHHFPSPTAVIVVVVGRVLVSVTQYVWWLGYRLGRFR